MTESSLYQTALSRATTLCSQREYCIEEIRSKLLQWGASDTDCESIINTLVKENFINERRYAGAFVRDKFKYNKWGRIKIAALLRIKKIPPEIINSALNEIDNDSYYNTLREMIMSHRTKVKAKNQYDLKGKLLRYGLSKGFESNLLYDILNDI